MACQLGVAVQAHRGHGFQYQPTIGLWQQSPSLLVQLHTVHNQLVSKVLEELIAAGLSGNGWAAAGVKPHLPVLLECITQSRPLAG